jgi:hypothetical protein
LVAGQRILLRLSADEEALAMEISSSEVSFSSLGGVKPTLESDSCIAYVQVYFRF